jgi:hypothetical protein
MAYEIPEIWQHGDYPTAAKLNKYKSGLDAIHAMWGDKDFEYPLIHTGGAAVAGELHSHWFINRYRYLVYNGEGSIHDPGNVFDTVSLEDASWATYDLTTIEWIIPGKLYEVQGVREAKESDTGT